jgi:hypothetical protein
MEELAVTQTPNPPSGLLTREQLLPCPFCGSTDIEPDGVASIKKDVRAVVKFWKDALPEHIINRPCCNTCGATTEGDWNTRAARQSPTAPAGWRVVPEEPTPEMIEAAGRKGAVFGFGFHYKVALASAPTPPNRATKEGEAEAYLKTLCDRIELYAKDKTAQDFSNAYQAYMDAVCYLAASKSVESWRDIASAPRDEVLIGTYYDTKYDEWPMEVFMNDDNGAYAKMQGFTHWRRKPAPPSHDTAREGG